ncbi:Hypothetical protein CINCED_3A019074 [Cinara cedri]|uniref:Uncharacterized protein n=1 Tax=Cinara cedri TaxID=506608 RepID=A0A5E4MU63_9HEMI|nr:Hypothetical protein CINCED_3A019074 [Cinara cedri]
MPSNSHQTEPISHGCPFVSSYDGSRAKSSFSSSSSSSSNDGSNTSNGISDFEDDSSWSGDYVCDGGSGGRNPIGGSSSSSGSEKRSESTYKGNKWIKAVLSMVQNGSADGKKRGKSSSKPVKSILRPLTTYRHVIGMSGLPLKVPVYPKMM